MATEGVIGVDVLVKIGSPVAAILGQRGAKMSVPRDMIDMSVKATFPARTYQPGWYNSTIDCDNLCYAGGSGGVATLVNTELEGAEVDIEVTIGSSGEKFEGSAFMNNVDLDAPQEGEATVTCQLTVNGALTATEGT